MGPFLREAGGRFIGTDLAGPSRKAGGASHWSCTLNRRLPPHAMGPPKGALTPVAIGTRIAPSRLPGYGLVITVRKPGFDLARTMPSACAVSREVYGSLREA